MLKFKNSPIRLYLWLQEPNKDDYGAEFLRKMNYMLLSKGSARNPEVPTRLRRKNTLSFTNILTVDNVRPLLSSPTLCTKLFPFIPNALPKSLEELESIIRSPQFLQVFNLGVFFILIDLELYG